MKILTHLNKAQYPLFIPQQFYNAFVCNEIQLNVENFISIENTPPQLFLFINSSSSVAYSLNNPLPNTISPNAFHSNVVESALTPTPKADGLYLALSKAKISLQFPNHNYLGLRVADCLAVVFSFENKEYFLGAIAHAGWRGLTSGILQNTLYLLRKEAQNSSISELELLKNLSIHISPAIFGISFECGMDVNEALSIHLQLLKQKYNPSLDYIELYNTLSDFSKVETFHSNILRSSPQTNGSSEKIFPDLQLLAALECVMSGIEPKNIYILRENTYTHPTLYSYRKATHSHGNKNQRQWVHLKFPKQ